MNIYLQDELHALDRVMYLLEEGSFQHLSLSDEEFADFVEDLYAKVNQQRLQLKAKIA